MSLRALIVVAIAATGCGSQIGDSCTEAIDCATDGTRECDVASLSGYCTIEGCDYNTCPSEATCVRFFIGGFTNEPCNPQTEDVPGGTDDCTIDELCALDGFCAPRSAEVRYCMKTCSDDGNCRDGYECRNYPLQVAHGGEVVVAPGMPLDETNGPSFCAQAPTSD